MTKDDIIRMAREAGWSGIYSQWVSPIEREHLTVPVTMEQIERFATLVAAAEREACAKLAEEKTRLSRMSLSSILGDDGVSHCYVAAAIRARGQMFNGMTEDETNETMSVRGLNEK